MNNLCRCCIQRFLASPKIAPLMLSSLSLAIASDRVYICSFFFNNRKQFNFMGVLIKREECGEKECVVNAPLCTEADVLMCLAIFEANSYTTHSVFVFFIQNQDADYTILSVAPGDASFDHVLKKRNLMCAVHDHTNDVYFCTHSHTSCSNIIAAYLKQIGTC